MFFSNNEILKNLQSRFKNIDVITSPEREGDVKHTLAYINKAKELLGYEPIVHFWDGLDRTIEWYDQNWETYKDIKLSI